MWIGAIGALLILAGCGKSAEPGSAAPTAAAPAPAAAAPNVSAAPTSPAGPSWELVRTKDEMTDMQRVSARLGSGGGGSGSDSTVLTVRCVGQYLEALATFDGYLGDDGRPVRYRVDQQASQQESWSVSAKGTAVFSPESVDFARQLLPARKLLIEATDFRGVAHRATYEWASGADKVEEVLRACNLTREGLEQQIPGLRKDIALQIERWGAQYIVFNKRALAAIAGFKGEATPEMTPEFALAVQSYSDDYTARCKAGKAQGLHCNTMRTLIKAKMEPLPLSVGSVIHDQAPKALLKELAAQQQQQNNNK